jgi:hypothetical protein
MKQRTSKLHLTRLEADPHLKECLYDLQEIVASQREIEDLLHKLDELVGRNPAEAAKHFTFLRVEIFKHLLKHIQNAKRPLAKASSHLYASLGQEEPPETAEPPTE